MPDTSERRIASYRWIRPPLFAKLAKSPSNARVPHYASDKYCACNAGIAVRER
jgi:hypothetical protein